MTNPNNTSQNPSSPLDPRSLRREELVRKLAVASPFKALLKLPPEEVLDHFRSRAGQALLEGLLEWKRRAAVELFSKLRTEPHVKAVDLTFITSGIDEVCTTVISLPEQVKELLRLSKGGK